MSSSSTAITAVRFSTDGHPASDGAALWRDLWGRSMLRVDIEPLPGEPFRADLTLRSLPGLQVMSGEIGASRTRRARELLADGNDDFGLAIALGGQFIVSQRGREVALAAGDATLVSFSDEATFTRPSATPLLGLRMPRRELMALLPDAEDAVMRMVPRGNPALKLLLGYSKALDGDFMTTRALQRIYVAHLYDVLALSLGATGDARELAKKRGVRAARLCAVKADIETHLLRSDLMIAAVAQRQNLTARYIQMLFKEEETTFSEFVLQQRLARVYRALVDPRFSCHNISTIVFGCGFGDLSHFNRHFRRRYGASPSEVRGDWRREEY